MADTQVCPYKMGDWKSPLQLGCGKSHTYTEGVISLIEKCMPSINPFPAQRSCVGKGGSRAISTSLLSERHLRCCFRPTIEVYMNYQSTRRTIGNRPYKLDVARYIPTDLGVASRIPTNNIGVNYEESSCIYYCFIF